MKSNIFLALSPSQDNRVILTQKILACEAKRSPLVKVQWTHTQDLHITIGFIANVDEKDLRSVAVGLTSISRATPFMAHAAEIKAYGNAIVMRMEPYPHFHSLHKKMNMQLSEQTQERYHFDTKKRYDPHMTIGRIKNLNALNLLHKQQLLSLVEEQFKNVSFLVQQAALMHRMGEPRGQIAYQILQPYPLTGAKE